MYGAKRDGVYWHDCLHIYDMPELFADVFRPIDVSDTQVDNLVGIGLGLLSNSINGTKL